MSGGGPNVPADARNLAYRAAAGFLAHAGARCGAALRLTKRVPAGAGLGGGSSDAGAVLRGLAALLPGAVPPDALLALALELGADVPFFLDPRPAEVSGVGERIAPAAGVPALPLIVLAPLVSVATAEVYAGFAAGAPALTATPSPPRFAPLPPRSASREAWAERTRNDLEPPATRLCPEIRRLRAALRDAGALAAGMSGSGAAVYGVFESEERRDQAIGRLRAAPTVRVYATTTTASP